LRTKIQGAVMLELIVRRDGLPDQIRVVRSLDPGGLDEERWWLSGSGASSPVASTPCPSLVLVTILLDFRVH
jgi:hypothetical protein